MLFYFLTTCKEFLFYIGFLDLQLIIGIIFKQFYFISHFRLLLLFFASYVILLSAAHDILTEQESLTPEEISTTVPR